MEVVVQLPPVAFTGVGGKIFLVLSLKPFRLKGSLSNAYFDSLFAGAGLLQHLENRLQRQRTALRAGK